MDLSQTVWGFPDCRILSNGKIYSRNLHPKMSANTWYTMDASEVHDVWRTRESITGVLIELIEEKIRGCLKPLNAQILTLTQLLN